MADLRRLGDVCEISREQSRPNASDQLRYIGLEHIKAGTGEILPPAADEAPFKGPGFSFDVRHVLYGKLRPYLNKVALPEVAGRCSMELVPLLPGPEVERDFLAALLRHPRTVEHVSSRNTGSRMPRADMALLLDFKVPVPPLDEQRNIVDLLSRVASLKRLAQEAQARARELAPALFVDMFGDPATNPKGWPIVPLSRAATDITSRVPAIQRRDYSDEGDVPIYDQGQKPIAGHSNDVEGAFTADGEVVLFGDHTRVFRRAMGTFYRGADGLKVLQPTEGASASYLCWFWTIHGLPDHGYSRHFKFLKDVPVALPPFEFQEQFKARLDEVESVSRLAHLAADVAERTSAALMSPLFAG